MDATRADYVIVGAGSAGCVLANRLTENPSVSMALLEAGGPDKKKEIRIPAAFSKLFLSDCDWAYRTQPQAGLNGRPLYWPRGRVLGGSSSINALIYTRGYPSDYDDWAAQGNQGWDFADILPYFKKSEHQERGASNYHGVGGPQWVSDPRFIHPISRAFLKAATELGLPHTSDFNGPEGLGAGLFQTTTKGGRRWSAADGYLKPVMGRQNLVVLTHAMTVQILFEKDRAVGVRYIKKGRTAEIRANREVLLCGGAVNSPQLLMLSGIGPASGLRRLGITVVHDLPGVGQNLQDHLLLPLVYACKQSNTFATAERLGPLLRYLFYRDGILTSNIGEAGAFLSTNPSRPGVDLELVCGAVYYLNHGIHRPKGHYFSLACAPLRPQSRGTITLRSKDPLESPIIDPNYLSDPADLAALREGVRLCSRLAQTRAFDPFRGPETSSHPAMENDSDIDTYARSFAETEYHPAGTCRMGRDPLAVVDDHLCVQGLRGLRVVDASIMPTLVSGHTHGPILMIAEKAADLIKDSANIPIGR